jgi:antitoxin component of MazEF toxin-antitoxin module
MTTYTRKIGRRGSGLWIRIPSAIVREMNLKAGGEIEIIGVGEHSFEFRCLPDSEGEKDE